MAPCCAIFCCCCLFVFCLFACCAICFFAVVSHSPPTMWGPHPSHSIPSMAHCREIVFRFGNQNTSCLNYVVFWYRRVSWLVNPEDWETCIVTVWLMMIIMNTMMMIIYDDWWWWWPARIDPHILFSNKGDCERWCSSRWFHPCSFSLLPRWGWGWYMSDDAGGGDMWIMWIIWICG